VVNTVHSYLLFSVHFSLMVTIGLIDIIDIISLDKESIEKDNSFPTSYAIYFDLSKQPDPNWKKMFDKAWKDESFNLKRKITVSGKRLRMVFMEDDNIQEQVNFVKRLVSKTNDYAKEYNEKIRQKEERLQQINQEVEIKKAKLKAKLKNVEL